MAFKDMLRHLTRVRGGAAPDVPGLLDARGFRRALEKSRERAERCGHPFSMVAFAPSEPSGDGLGGLARQVVDRARLSDEAGWCDDGRLGVILYGASGQSALVFARSVLDNGNQGRFTYSVFHYPGRESGGGGLSKPGKGQEKEGSSDGRRNTDHAPGAIRGGADECQVLFAKPHPPWKRILDFAGAALALLLASPFMLPAALWIKAVSPGPVFFRQERVGRGGKPFTMLKFRTMHTHLGEACHQDYMCKVITDGEAPMIKLDAGDPRIIRGGRLLRKLCIDELPQLFNVLKGDMSLVGPRPPIGYEVAEYQRWCRGRLDCVPGMTGLWQVSGKNRLTFKEMARLDIFYANNISPWLDLKIILCTPLAIARQLMDGVSGNARAKRSAGGV